MPEEARVRVAEYVRMSTDQQRYSIENQRTAIAAYAEAHGMEVVRTFADAGKSGLTLSKRAALQSLLHEIVAGSADFAVLLVYDVSRWGRFQDVDESAHYEFLCRQAGVTIVYCAEPFDNDGTPFASLYKGLKRVMAGEYSRELSVKVRAGRARLAGAGYFYGGAAGYGLRRLLIDKDGRLKGVLQHGEHKNIQSDHMLFTLGPPEEVAVVRRIYGMFIDDKLEPTAIAGILNSEGLKTDRGTRWSNHVVTEILRHEKYIGNIVFNRYSALLGAKQKRNAEDQLVRVDGAFEAIVDRARYDQAQAIFANRRLTKAQLLRRLKALYESEGRLSTALMKKAGLPSAQTYVRHFGSVFEAYSLVGYEVPTRRVAAIAALLRERSNATSEGDPVDPEAPRRRRRWSQHPQRIAASRALIETTYQTDDEMLRLLRDLWQREGSLSTTLIESCPQMPSARSYRFRFGGLLTAYRKIGYEPPRWRTLSFASRMRGHGPSTASENGHHHRSPAELERLAVNKRAAVEDWFISDVEMLRQLRALHDQHGRLSSGLINQSPTLPAARTYIRRFGSLFTAYRLIGFEQRSSHLQGIALAHRARELRRAQLDGASRFAAQGPDQLRDAPENGGQPE